MQSKHLYINTLLYLCVHSHLLSQSMRYIMPPKLKKNRTATMSVGTCWEDDAPKDRDSSNDTTDLHK